MSMSFYENVRIGVVVAVILHLLIITFVAIAAFFTLYAYVWSIVGLMPVSLALGSYAGVTLWWMKLNDQRVLLTLLVIIGMIAAGTAGVFLSELLGEYDRYIYTSVSLIGAVSAGIIAESIFSVVIYAVRYKL